MLVVLVVALAALSSSAPPASAASCSYSTSPTFTDYYEPTGIYYTALIHNCVDVVAVRWLLLPHPTARTGWYDWACFCWAVTASFTRAPGAWPFVPGPDVTLYNPCTGVCGVWVSSPLWFYGQCRPLAGVWYSQIMSAATYQWSWPHAAVSAPTWICRQ